MKVIKDRYKLYQGDCLEVMDELIKDDVKVDMILTDPPYGIDLTPQRENGKFKNTKVINDNNLCWLPKFVNQIYALTKNTAIIFCAWQNIDKFKIELEKKFTIKNILVWNKDWFGMGNNYRPNYELILLCCKTNITTKSKNKSNILTYRRIPPQKLKHSCEKPVGLLEDLIYELTDENDIVLDSFMGSGSTGVACLNTNRRFIGIELDEKYFTISYTRLENPMYEQNQNKINDKQKTLF
jgi:site-specific DNA-methyltransferase (adenine-specific)|nr:MAG TPA: adenine-specific methyltransferase [Caudoviricetes sp.]